MRVESIFHVQQPSLCRSYATPNVNNVGLTPHLTGLGVHGANKIYLQLHR